MELIDIVDELGNFTGEVMEKEEAHDKNLLHNEIAVFIINDNNQVLLQKRSSAKRFDPNKWALCAGHVDFGESLSSAAIREIKEEVGITITESELHPYKEREFIIKESNSHINYYYYIKSNKDEADFVIQEEELSEVKWFDIDEIIEMIKNNDESIVFKENKIHLFEGLKEL